MIPKVSIVFVVSDFDMGGITTSMRNLTDILVREGHRVGIVDLPRAGRLPEGFNPDVELIPLCGKARYWNLNAGTICHAPLYKLPFILLLAILKKLLNRTNKWRKFIFSDTLITGYDVAIAFRQSPLCYHFVQEVVDAPRKIGFWHGDPDYMDGIEYWIDSLSCVDYVACVSKAVENRMRERYPQYSQKYKTIYNIFRADAIKEKSLEYKTDYQSQTCNLVTVARIEFGQKQLNFIPEIARRLRSKSISFQWTLVGDGPDHDALEQLIQEKRVTDCVRFVGNKPNPYPYISNADLFVNTSLGEAYGMVVMESLILGTPCVAAEYPALREIIHDGQNGVIVENSIDGITDAIEGILMDPDRLSKLQNKAKAFQYSYVGTYEMLMELCEQDGTSR